MASSFKNIIQIFFIVWVLARYDALFFLKQTIYIRILVFIASIGHGPSKKLRDGQRLAVALQTLGPSYIKFGQAMATRPDLVGEKIATDLSELQDQLPPFSSNKARDIIQATLGRSIDELFLEFDNKPIAAASIAQVHRAKTKEGELVAVKVLRPDIEKAFAKDLKLFSWLANLAERIIPASRRLKPKEAIQIFSSSVQIEMDLRLEGAAAAELSENMSIIEEFIIPKVYWSHTGREVLTLQWMEGIRIDDIQSLRSSGHDPAIVLSHAANAFFRQVFYHGFFHADLHPGNLLVNPNGNVVAVDFGIMGRLEKQTRCYLAEMLLGFLSGNYERVADIHFEAGYVPKNQSRTLFKQAVRAIGEPIMEQPLKDISVSRLLGHLFQVTRSFEMETQPQLLLLQKSLLMAEGLSRQLNPEGNMWQIARPLIEDWAATNMGPKAQVSEIIKSGLMATKALPNIIKKTETVLDELEQQAKNKAKGNLNLSIFKKQISISNFLLFIAISLLTVLIVLISI